MPLYEFENTVTGEHWEQRMTFAESNDLLEEFPEFRRIVCAPMIVSGIGDSVKVDGAFKDILQQTAAKNPHSPLAAQHGDKGIKAVKTREVVKKHFGSKPD